MRQSRTGGISEAVPRRVTISRKSETTAGKPLVYDRMKQKYFREPRASVGYMAHLNETYSKKETFLE
jgi:hypothetical protein